MSESNVELPESETSIRGVLAALLRITSPSERLNESVPGPLEPGARPAVAAAGASGGPQRGGNGRDLPPPHASHRRGPPTTPGGSGLHTFRTCDVWVVRRWLDACSPVGLLIILHAAGA